MRGAIANVPTRLPLIGLMPSIFQEDFVTGRFCAGLDDVMAPALATLDCLDAYVDPALAPEDFLEWLGGWVGALIIEDWPAARKRNAVATAAGLHRSRGTVAGLREELALYTGGDVVISESGGVAISRTPGGPLPGQAPPHLHVKITVDDLSSIQERVVNAIVAASKPAHVEHQVDIVERSQG
jgi:phage tail-like protein